MIVTFTDRGGEFFAFNLDNLKGISCYRQEIAIEDKNNHSVWYAVPTGEVEKVKKQLEKISKNA